jgi:hypothetical protein
MLTCESAEALMVRDADGVLTPLERDLLDRHTGGCDSCLARRGANRAVKAVLAQRVDADVPPGFAARVMARAVPDELGGRLSDVDWRRWTEWMLPVAAGLALFVVLAGSTSPAASTEIVNEPAGVESAAVAEDELTAGSQALNQDVTSEELLAAMLGAPVGGAEGAGDGR